MMRLIRPLTMIATLRDTAVATPIFCSITSTAMSPSSPRRTQHLLDLGDDDRREPLGRLVHDQELRIGEQRAGDREHLLLAAGELAAAIVLALGQPRKGLVDALDRPGAAAQPAASCRCSSTVSERHSRRPCGT